jgi:hypothetical protein
MEAALMLSGRLKTMKTLLRKVVGFVKKEWFLIAMVITITLIILLFELLN